MHKPAFAVVQFHPTALMRAIHRCIALEQHISGLPRSGHTAGAQHSFPARLHAARWGENVIPPVALVDLRPFQRRLIAATVINDTTFAKQGSPIRGHGKQLKLVLDAAAAMSKGMHQPGVTVVVPEWTRINPAFRRLHAVRYAPCSPGIVGLTHEDSLIRRAEKHP